MADGMIYHRLDLAVRLIDTTTGMAVCERRVRFGQDDRKVRMISRGGGMYICIDKGRKPFSFTADVYGYESTVVNVDYERLDARLPAVEVNLIPKEKLSPESGGLLTLRGKKKGLSLIQAVKLEQSKFFIGGYDEKKKQASLFNPHKSSVEHTHYGIIHRGEDDYEAVEATEMISDSVISIRDGLQRPFAVNDPVERIVFGQVSGDGNYLLRVQDVPYCTRYLVRYVVEGREQFREIDFQGPDREKGL